jgi:hypothetical protein
MLNTEVIQAITSRVVDPRDCASASSRHEIAGRGSDSYESAPHTELKRMESIYRVEGALAETSAFAGGPWSPKLQHGAAPSSLIC